MLAIKIPKWKTGGCLTIRHIQTPEGWLGLRQETWGWVVTGVVKQEWQDLKRFPGNSEEEAEKFAINLYYEQVSKWLESSEI